MRHLVYDAPIAPRIRSSGPFHHVRDLADELCAYFDVNITVPSKAAHQVGQGPAVTRIPTAADGGGLFFVEYEARSLLQILRTRWQYRSTEVIFLTRVSRLPLRPLVARLVGFTTIVEINVPLADEVSLRRSLRVLPAIVRLLVVAQLRAAHGAIAVSPGLAREAASLAQVPCVVVANGARRLVADAWHVAGDRPINLGFLGLADHHDLRGVLDALGDRVRSLTVVGDLLDVADLQKAYPQVEITVTGFLDRQAAQSELVKCDVAICALKPKSVSGASASPLKLYEYMALDMPVLSSDTDGSACVDAPGVYQYVHGDEASILAAFERLSTDWPEMTSIVRKREKASWSWEDRAESVARFCTEVSARRRRELSRFPRTPLVKTCVSRLLGVAHRAGLTRYRLRRAESADLRKLEIGPGGRRIPGFETLSARPWLGVDYVGDAAERLPFPDDTFETIYASHVLEHLPWFAVEAALQEWVRVLKPGGKLEIWVPDGYKIAAAIVDCEREDLVESPVELDGWRRFNPKSDVMTWANGRLFSYGDGSLTRTSVNWHRSTFTPKSLQLALRAVGLVQVREMDRSEVRGHDHGWINLGVVGEKQR